MVNRTRLRPQPYAVAFLAMDQVVRGTTADDNRAQPRAGERAEPAKQPALAFGARADRSSAYLQTVALLTVVLLLGAVLGGSIVWLQHDPDEAGHPG